MGFASLSQPHPISQLPQPMACSRIGITAGGRCLSLKTTNSDSAGSRPTSMSIGIPTDWFSSAMASPDSCYRFQADTGQLSFIPSQTVGGAWEQNRNRSAVHAHTALSVNYADHYRETRSSSPSSPVSRPPERGFAPRFWRLPASSPLQPFLILIGCKNPSV